MGLGFLSFPLAAKQFGTRKDVKTHMEEKMIMRPEQVIAGFVDCVSVRNYHKPL